MGQRGHAFTQLKTSVLCRRDAPITSDRGAIGWWEARRIPFNLLVGSAGIVSCIVVGVVGMGSSILFGGDFALPNPPLVAVLTVLIYGIIANILFTGGWLAELVVRQVSPQEADRFATLSFSLGVVFSVLLTLSPGIVVGAAGIFGVLRHLFGVVAK